MMVSARVNIGDPLATIGDVARVAGVSRSTVSYALSGKRPIKQETRDRINAAIDQLGFTVNAGARALATAQTHVIALHVRFHSDEFAVAMTQYVVPLADALRERGYDMLMTTEEDGAAAIERMTSSRRVDGIILLDVHDHDERVSVIRKVDRPSVLIGLPKNHEGVTAVDLDFSKAGRVLVDVLHEAGHSELLLITPPPGVFRRGGEYARRFRDAAVSRAQALGLDLHVEAGPADGPGAHADTDSILNRYPNVTGLIVHNDATVAILPEILRQRNASVPKDLSVVSLFSEPFSRLFHLDFSAIDTIPATLAQLAVNQLVDTIEQGSNQAEPGITLLEPILVDRGSISNPPAHRH